MSTLTTSNLQEFCRFCLQRLALGKPNDASTTCPGAGYNIYSLPNLANLMIFFTTLDEVERNQELGFHEEDIFPRRLCHLCYDKLQGFNDFRQLTLKSTAFLRQLVTSQCGATGNDLIEKQEEEPFNDDDQLLLPELAPLINKTIKTEKYETEAEEEEEQELKLPLNTLSLSIIKNEIDSNSEYDDNEEERELEQQEALNYSRQNDDLDSTSSNYDTRADDADDEECALRSGAANPSAAASKHLPQLLSKRGRDKKSLKCPRCDKQAYKQVYLDAHIRSVHEGNKRPFLCDECQKSFTRYNHLNQHIKSHTQMLVCKFSGCTATFRRNQMLEVHLKVVHSSADGMPFQLGLQQMLEVNSNETPEDTEHFCQQCLRNYSSKRALSEHMKRHAQIREHICQVCGVAKVTRTELQTHMRIHEPNSEKFKCTQCPQEFNHKNAISRHVRVVHEGQRNFVCSYCQKRFGTRNSQMSHERLHTGERPFVCQICQKGFAQLEGLKSHMKNHDTTLRKYVCSFCAKRFITRKNLVDHEQRHRSDKPHICNQCSRGYFKAEDLATHQKTHNAEVASSHDNDNDAPRTMPSHDGMHQALDSDDSGNKAMHAAELIIPDINGSS